MSHRPARWEGAAALRVAIIGAGRVGTLRASVAARAGDQVGVIVDADAARARSLAQTHSASWTTDWRDVLTAADIDAVVVATITSVAAEISVAALREAKHVLHEKPMGRNVTEARRLLDAARTSRGVLKIGFNHRHHHAIARAHQLADGGAIGVPYAIRAAYGHGGRPGYEREWRCDPAVSGGGELVDQGVHVIDLARWFLGDFIRVSAATATWYWPIQPLEDNAFALLTTSEGRVAALHVSWTQWRNMFRFEVLGSKGYLIVDGLGGTYGTERLTFGRRRPDWTRPDEEQWQFTGPDTSWTDEWSEFRQAIHDRRRPLASGEDGYAVALIVDAIYRAAAGATSVEVPPLQAVGAT